jgi:hypothetical protein
VYVEFLRLFPWGLRLQYYPSVRWTILMMEFDWSVLGLHPSCLLMKACILKSWSGDCWRYGRGRAGSGADCFHQHLNHQGVQRLQVRAKSFACACLYGSTKTFWRNMFRESLASICLFFCKQKIVSCYLGTLRVRYPIRPS